MMRLAPAVVLLLPAIAAAQEVAPIVTDRPDFTESAVVVPVEHVQIEGGFTWESMVNESSTSFPEVLGRWTPVRRIEVRLGFPDYVVGGSSNGFSDGSLGVKIQIGPHAGWDLGLIASVSVSVGEDAQTSNSVDSELIFIVSRDINSRVSLGEQGMLSFDGIEDVWQYGATLVAGIGLSERLGTFARRW